MGSSQTKYDIHVGAKAICQACHQPFYMNRVIPEELTKEAKVDITLIEEETCAAEAARAFVRHAQTCTGRDIARGMCTLDIGKFRVRRRPGKPLEEKAS